jgi:hypothetical protein
MSRSKARLAADWFAKLRINAATQAIEHDDIKAVETEVAAVSDSVSNTVTSQLTSVSSDVQAVSADVSSLSGAMTAKLDASVYTAADVLTKVKTVDGAGSGLDADTLDGQHASAFQPAGSYLTGNQTITLTGDASGSGTTSINVTVADDSHNHVISNVDGLQAALDGKASTSHSHTIANVTGLQAALDGKQASGSYLTGNQTITLTGDVSGSGTTSIAVTIADDSHNHIIANVDGLQAALDGKLSTSGKAADSNLLDGIDSSGFVRSNAADEISITGGLPLSIRRTGSSSAATNGRTLEVVQNYGNHSWGIVSEFRVDGTSGSDRPSILFSTGYNTDTWSVGFGGTDSNFRINRDHGHRNSSWGTTLMNMDRSGNVTFSGNVTAYSDERLKSNIKTIEGAVDTVKALRGVTFEKDGKPNLGVIAQEVQKVLPEVVQEGEEYLSVAYGNMVGLLIEAIKEQQTQIDELKAKLEG